MSVRPDLVLIGEPAGVLVDGDGLPAPYVSRRAGDDGRLNFAGESMRGRIPKRIVADVIVDNADWLPAAAADELAQLQAGLTSLDGVVVEQICYLSDADAELWRAGMGAWYGRRWRDAPWLHGEIYLYRRILAIAAAATSLPVARLPDIFRQQKDRAIALAAPGMARLWRTLADDGSFGEHVLASLWANQMDLALYDAADSVAPRPRTLLDDQSGRLHQHVVAAAASLPRIDFVLDNNGMELFCDLAFAVHLLRQRLAGVVVLHAKSTPFFVSDTTVDDVPLFLDRLARDAAELGSFIERVRSALASGQLQIASHPFWTAPLEFADMPADLRHQLAAAQLVVCKGDLNYRRLIGDRRWHPCTPFEQIVAYFPTSVAALRTNKSELVCSLRPDCFAGLPDDWLVSGQFGVVHFACRPENNVSTA